MAKPENKYKVGSTIWSVMEGDWTDLTVSEIAEVLDISVNHVRAAMEMIKKETGYAVPYLRVRDREGLTEQKTSCKDGTAQKSGPNRELFQKRLREMRKRNKISAKLLSELCGLSKNAVGTYESGEKLPSLHSLVRLADYFGVPLDYLLGRTNSLQRPT